VLGFFSFEGLWSSHHYVRWVLVGSARRLNFLIFVQHYFQIQVYWQGAKTRGFTSNNWKKNTDGERIYKWGFKLERDGCTRGSTETAFSKHSGHALFAMGKCVLAHAL
jgi:hypothetical protein